MQGVIRRRVAAPATLAFDTYAFEPLYGMNSAGVNITEDGYSVVVSGSSADGPFRTTCYMTKAFAITVVR